MRKPKVTVVIPTRDEESAVGSVIDEVVDALEPGFDYELILVDKSTDRTPQRVAQRSMKNHRIRLIRQKDTGYGSALIHGFTASRGDYLAMLDADLTYTASDLPLMFALLIEDQADLVVGNRVGTATSMPLLNRIGNRLITAAFNLKFRLGIKDSQCGMRAFKKEFLRRFATKEAGMPFSTEMLIHASRMGSRIRNLDTTYRPRVGKTKLDPFKDGLAIIRTILRSA